MKNLDHRSDVIRLIRFAAILWIAYTVVLILANQLTGPRNASPPLYYILNGCVALVCLGLAYWRWIQERLNQAFLPVIIAIITIMPLINNWLARATRFPGPFGTPGTPGSPQLLPEGPVLGMLPFLIVALLLVAWQYRWQYILLVILGIAGINLLTIFTFSAPDTMPFQGGLNITLIQTVMFLAVGLSISYLMTRMRQQQQSLEKANMDLTHYASTLEQLTTSRERNRLARDLHDTLAHTLSGLAVQLETAKAYWDVDQQMARAVLEKSVTAARSGLEETRRALKALRASPLDDLGLALAIRTMVEDAKSQANLALDLSIADKMPGLSPDVEQCVYRVAQEAIANVVEHASAKNLAVKLEFKKGKLAFTVKDDGIGFKVEEGANASHYGLAGMRERAQLFGGELSIASEPGQGTTVQLTI